MTFPAVLSVEEQQITTPAQSYSIAMPATVSAGDLLIMFVTHDQDNTAAFDSVSGWTELRNALWGNLAQGRLGIWYKSASGSEGGTNVTVSFTGSNRPACAFVVRIQAGTWNTGSAPELAAANDVSANANPDPPNLAPSWGSDDNLWIVYEVNDQDRSINAYPTNYGSNQSFAWISGQTDDHTTALATREAAAASENPGTFTISTSDQWGAVTLAVRGSAAAPQSQAPRTMHQQRMRRAA
ncbi:MAG TPA: hypothetical protein VIB47_07530 [Dehalococcoidia bacterium]